MTVECVSSAECPDSRRCVEGTCVVDGTGGSGAEGGASSDGGANSGGANDGGAGGAGANGGTSGGGPADGGCTTGTANVFVTFDRSFSMVDNDRWSKALAGLTLFFQDRSSANLSVALRFFPHDSPVVGCNGSDSAEPRCDVGACAVPLVALGTLIDAILPDDAQEQALVDALAQVPAPEEYTGSPLLAALSGAHQWALTQRVQQPNDTTAVVLVTDGLSLTSSVCGDTIGDLTTVAAGALDASQVRTYVIGLEPDTGSIAADVEAIATAGGTTHFYSAYSADTQSDLFNALATIKQQLVAACP